MRFSRWPAIAAGVLVLVSCFFTWVTVPSLGVSIGGFHATIADYGKPGILHAFFCSLCLLFLLINKLWSIRTAFFVSTINIAWGLRNFFIISACRMGICPEKQPALYMLLISSVAFTLLILAARAPAAGQSKPPAERVEGA